MEGGIPQAARLFLVLGLLCFIQPAPAHLDGADTPEQSSSLSSPRPDPVEYDCFTCWLLLCGPTDCRKDCRELCRVLEKNAMPAFETMTGPVTTPNIGSPDAKHVYGGTVINKCNNAVQVTVVYESALKPEETITATVVPGGELELKEKFHTAGTAGLRYTIKSVRAGTVTLAAPFPEVNSPTKIYFWLLFGDAKSPNLKGSLAK
eukprot:RCo055369